MTPTRIAILGSTGSIGRQALDVVREQPGRFVVVALAAGRSAYLLAEQALDFGPRVVCLTGGDTNGGPSASDVPERLRAGPWEVLCGERHLSQLATLPEAELVLVATSGRVALPATLAAVSAGKD